MKKSIILLAVVLFLISSCSKKKPVSIPSQEFDLDFTKMNYNMTSSILFEMLIEPEKYVNKSVKISGQFETAVYEGTRYFSVINWDATGCCPTGIDFIPPSTMNYPEDFPESGTTITVTGTMKTVPNDEDNRLFFFATSVDYIKQ